jgi:hypothetical protein
MKKHFGIWQAQKDKLEALVKKSKEVAEALQQKVDYLESLNSELHGKLVYGAKEMAGVCKALGDRERLLTRMAGFVASIMYRLSKLLLQQYIYIVTLLSSSRLKDMTYTC